jgi:hypothetical protein
MGPGHAGGLDRRADRQGDWPIGPPSLPTPQACPRVPTGVAVFALCRDPETHALFLIRTPRMLPFADIDRRRRGALLPGLRWDQHRRRTQLARGTEPPHPEPCRACPLRDRPWRASPAAHQRQEVRAWRPNLAQAGPEGAEWGPWSIFVAWTIFAIVLWIVVTALAYYTYTAKSPGWGMIPRRAGQDGPSGAVQITGRQLLGAVMVRGAPAGKTPPAGVLDHGLATSRALRAPSRPGREMTPSAGALA